MMFLASAYFFMLPPLLFLFLCPTERQPFACLFKRRALPFPTYRHNYLKKYEIIYRA